MVLDGKQAAVQGTRTNNIELIRRAKKRRRSGDNSHSDDDNSHSDDDNDNNSQGRQAALMQRDKKEKAVRKAMQQVLGQQDVGFDPQSRSRRCTQ